MKFKLFALLLAVSFVGTAAAQTSYNACLSQWKVAQDALSNLPLFTKAQQKELWPVQDMVDHKVAFLQSPEGRTAYAPLCTVELLGQLQSVTATAQSYLPPSQGQQEATRNGKQATDVLGKYLSKSK